MAEQRDILYNFKANVRDLKSKADDVAKAIGGISKDAQTMSQKVGSAAGTAGKWMTAGLTVPLVAVAKGAIDVATTFEQQMNRVGAIAGTTGNELDKLRQQAIELGADSVFGATDVALAMEELASQGFVVEDIMSAMPGLISLAAVSGGDMALSAQAVGSAVNQFGLDMSDTERIANIYARTAADTNAETRDLALALSFAGPTAAAMGMEIEEAAAAIGVMSNAGTTGARAGTALRGIMTRLIKPTKQAKDMMNELGIETFNSDGTMKSMSEIIEILQGSLNGLNDEQKQLAITTMFGQGAMSGVLALLDTAPGEYDAMTESIRNSEGAAQEMADQMMQGLPGALEELDGSLETARIRLAEGLAPAMMDSIEKINKLLDAFSALSTEQITQIVQWGKLIAVLGPALLIFSKVFPSLVGMASGFKMVATGAGTVAGAITKTNSLAGALGGILGKGFALLKTLATFLIGKLTAALTAVATAVGLTVGQFLLIIAVVAGVVAAGVWLYKNWDTVKEKASELWQAVKVAWDNMKEAISTKTREIWESVKTWFSELGTSMAEGWTNMVESAKAKWEELKASIGEKLTAIWTGVVEWVENMVASALDLGSRFLSGVVTFFQQLPDQILYWLGFALGFIVTFVAQAVLKAWELGSQFLSNVGEWLSQLPERIGAWVKSTYDRVTKWVSDMLTKAKEVGTKFLTTLVDWFKQLPGRVATFITDTYKKVTTWASNMWSKAKEVGSRFLNTMVEWFTQLPGRIGNFITSTYNRVTTWVGNMLAKAREVGSRFITSVVEFFSQLPGRIWTWLVNTLNKVTTWGTNLYNKGKAAGKRLLDAIVTEAKKIPGKIMSIGGDVVKGFWKGITNLGGWLKGKVGSFFGGIVDGAKKALKIFSPSRVFEDEVGKMVVLGFGKGIDRNEKEAVNPMRDMLDNVLGVWDGGTNDLRAQIGGMIGGTIGTDINMTENYIPSQSAEITFSLGNKNYRGFVEDISKTEGENVRLEEIYSLG